VAGGFGATSAATRGGATAGREGRGAGDGLVGSVLTAGTTLRAVFATGLAGATLLAAGAATGDRLALAAVEAAARARGFAGLRTADRLGLLATFFTSTSAAREPAPGAAARSRARRGIPSPEEDGGPDRRSAGSTPLRHYRTSVPPCIDTPRRGWYQVRYRSARMDLLDRAANQAMESVSSSPALSTRNPSFSVATIRCLPQRLMMRMLVSMVVPVMSASS